MRARLPHLPAWLLVVLAGAVLWAHELPLPGAGRLDTHSPFTLLAAMRVPITLLVLVLGVVLLAWSALVRWSHRPSPLTPTDRAPSAAASTAERQGSGTGGPDDARSPTAAPATRESSTTGRVVRAASARAAPSLLAPVALVLLAASSAVQIAPRAIADGGTPAPSGGVGAMILSANVLRSSVRPATIVGLVRRTRAQVVALPEANARISRSYVRALEAATGERWTATTEARGGPDDDGSARPTSLLSRADLRAERLPATRGTDDGHGAVRVRLALRGGGTMVVSAVHPLPPALAASQDGWRRNLLALRPRCAAGEVLAGDFNATLDHSPFRALLDAGCADAAAGRGEGLRATWSGGPLGLVRPAIDHVLTGGRWRAVSGGVLPLPGSDHRAVWARVLKEG